MKKLIIYRVVALAMLALAFSSCRDANVRPIVPPELTPTPKDSVWGGYFPNSPNSSWTYVKTVNSIVIDTFTVTIEKRVLLLKKISASRRRIVGGEIDSVFFTAIIEDSVFIYADPDDLTNPKKVYKQLLLPAYSFQNWKVRKLNDEFGSDRASGGSEINDLQTPAGTFHTAYEIERITDAQYQKAHEWLYFVPSIGIVKREIINNSTNDNIVWELINYRIEH